MREVWLEDEAGHMSAETVSALDIPAHVPSILRRGDVAKVLGLKSEQVAYFTRRKRLAVIREERYSGWWYAYSPRDVAAFAESRKIVPNWSILE